MDREKRSSNISLAYINEMLRECPDVIQKKVYIDNQKEAFFFFVDGLTNKDLLQRDFINPILAMDQSQLSSEIHMHNLSCNETSMLYENADIVDSILSGNSVFICEEISFAVACSLLEIEKRSIEEPITEKNVRGSHEGFVEPLGVNLSIIRRKIKNNKLKFKTVTLGVQTKQKVVVAYIEGIANPELVDGLFDKISNIEIDGLNQIGYIEQSIASHPNSLFPQFLATERPDKAMASLLEGRIVVFQDGTPVVLIAPVNFFAFFQAIDDYSSLWIQGSLLRLLRFIALVVAILLPSLYIAITTYHYHAVPLDLLVPLAESRAKVPFPPIIEVLILEVTIEMLREAAIRLPTYIGTAISVVAGLIIGEAAVKAGIVSDLLIVIVAATAVASYVIPSYGMSLAVRVLRFCFILAASLFGIIGIVVCTAMTFAHLLTLESLGQPYFEPFIPLALGDMKDTLLRFPFKAMRRREKMIRTNNDIRGNDHDRKK
ncbi:spore gernimation protein [Clostridium aceticum]|nr:spore gernimation protein [Clostridium aceticum]